MPSVTRVFSGPPIAIPDVNATGINNGLAFVGAIPAGAIMTGLTVTIDITHTFDGDLDISLQAPSNAVIDLTSDNGGGADNYTFTTFSDGAADSITGGTAPFTGYFRPEQPLSSLLSPTNLGGAWLLRVVDDAGGDTGTLNHWSITISFVTGQGTSAGEALGGTGEVDRLYGRGGGDQLLAQAGDDFLFGGDGQDLLRGGLGRDVMQGDDLVQVRDLFDFDSIQDSGITQASRDFIRDFKHLTDDIDLFTIDANTLIGGNQAFRFIGVQGFHRSAGELRIFNFSGDTIVAGDVNGDAIADFTIQLDGLIPLTGADFIL